MTPNELKALAELADRCEREEASWGLTCEIEAALNPGARILVSTAYAEDGDPHPSPSGN